MIPYIRSLSELMAITESRESKKHLPKKHESWITTMDSGQRKRYTRSLEKKEINLPDMPKIIRRKWLQKKVQVSKLIDELDYNNQFQSSYDLTLLERQNKTTQQDAA